MSEDNHPSSAFLPDDPGPFSSQRRRPFQAGDRVEVDLGRGRKEEWDLACDEWDGRVTSTGSGEAPILKVHARLLKASTQEERLKMLEDVARRCAGGWGGDSRGPRAQRQLEDIKILELLGLASGAGAVIEIGVCQRALQGSQNAREEALRSITAGVALRAQLDGGVGLAAEKAKDREALRPGMEISMDRVVTVTDVYRIAGEVREDGQVPVEYVSTNYREKLGPTISGNVTFPARQLRVVGKVVKQPDESEEKAKDRDFAKKYRVISIERQVTVKDVYVILSEMQEDGEVMVFGPAHTSAYRVSARMLRTQGKVEREPEASAPGRAHLGVLLPEPGVYERLMEEFAPGGSCPCAKFSIPDGCPWCTIAKLDAWLKALR